MPWPRQGFKKWSLRGKETSAAPRRRRFHNNRLRISAPRGIRFKVISVLLVVPGAQTPRSSKKKIGWLQLWRARCWWQPFQSSIPRLAPGIGQRLISTFSSWTNNPLLVALRLISKSKLKKCLRWEGGVALKRGKRLQVTMLDRR